MSITSLPVTREPDVSPRGQRTLTVKSINTLRGKNTSEKEDVNKRAVPIYSIPGTASERKFHMHTELI